MSDLLKVKVGGSDYLCKWTDPYVDEWTSQNVPSDIETQHDFNDGQGKVPAIPVNSASISDTIYQATFSNAGIRYNNSASISDTIYQATFNNAGIRYNNSASISDTIIDLEVIQ